MEKLAKVVSAVLHPLWMPLFTLVLAYLLDPFLGVYPALFRFLVFIVLVNTIAPGISILLMKRRGIISDLEISNRRERLLPFVLFLFYYALSYLLIRMRNTAVPDEVLIIFFAVLVSLVLGMVVNRFTKISIHLMAMGGLVGVLAALNELHLLGLGGVVALFLMGAGLLGWSRISQGYHTHAQVYSGFLVGFGVHYLLLMTQLYL